MIVHVILIGSYFLHILPGDVSQVKSAATYYIHLNYFELSK